MNNKSDTPFTDLLQTMTLKQIQEITTVVLEAALVFELNGDWRTIFIRARNRRVTGRLRQIYTFLTELDDTQIEQVCATMTKELNSDRNNQSL